MCTYEAIIWGFSVIAAAAVIALISAAFDVRKVDREERS